MSNNQYPINDQILMTNNQYNLSERTIIFSKKIIDFLRKMPQNIINNPLINQLVRAGTAIGANYSEADEAGSKKDFINKMYIAKKEIKETRYWLRLIIYAIPSSAEEGNQLLEEARQLNLIFAAIINKTKLKA